MKPIKLHPGEHVAAVVPERGVAGLAWLMLVHIHNSGAGTFRTEYVMPDERTDVQRALFDPGAAMCDALLDSVPTKRVKA